MNHRSWLDLAAAETKTTDHPDAAALAAYLEGEKSAPTFTIGQLR